MFNPWLLVIPVAVVGAFLFAADDGSPDIEIADVEDWRRVNAKGIELLAGKLRDAGIIDQDLVNFLVVVGWTEARWSWKAGSSARNNKARGMFGLRPKSAWDQTNLGNINDAQIAALKDPEWGIALALDYLSRLYPYLDAGQEMTALRARCGWAFPSMTDDKPSCIPDRPELWDRMRKAIAMVGLPESFATRKLELNNWPGVSEAVAIMRA